MTLGERMKEVRRNAGIKQAEFGALFGVKEGTVTSWETGLRNPSNAILSAICEKFSVNREWLLTGEGEMLRQLSEDEELELIFDQIHMSTDPTIRAIIRAYWKLPDNAKAAVRQFIMAAAGDQCHHRPQQRQAGRHLRPYQPAGQAGRS